MANSGILKLAPTLLVAAMMSACSHAIANAQESKKTGDPMALLKDAYAASTRNLRSGIGDGVFELYASKEEAGKLELFVKANAHIDFDNGKYRIGLGYSKTKVESASRVFVFDGTVIVSSEFDPAGKSTRSLGQIWEVPVLRNKRLTAPYSAGFPFDPTKLPDEMVNVDELQNNPQLKASLKFERKKEGVYQFSCRRDDTVFKFDIDAAAGFNVTSLEFLADGQPIPTRVLKAVWAKSGNVWFVKSIDDVHHFLGGKVSRRTVFRYDKFEANVPVPAETFRLKSLQLSEGDQILDFRPNADPDIDIRYSSKKNPRAKKAECLLDEINDLIKQKAPGARSHMPPK